MNQQECVVRAERKDAPGGWTEQPGEAQGAGQPVPEAPVAEPRRGSKAPDDDALLVGLTPEQRARLLRFRRQVRRGERSDALPADKRQGFVRWLVEHGRLSDN